MCKASTHIYACPGAKGLIRYFNSLRDSSLTASSNGISILIVRLSIMKIREKNNDNVRKMLENVTWSV